MMEHLIVLAVGLIGGGCVGFVLGTESLKRCADCLREGSKRYADGYNAGWKTGVGAMAGAVRRDAVRAKNTWTITHGELDRLESDLTAVTDE